jgi:phosphatidylserine decarboxylase
MEVLNALIISLVACLILLASGYLYWRTVWFFRNPRREIPEGENIVSPADGTIVYTKILPPERPVIALKGKRTVSVSDIVKEDLSEAKLLIGIFMSPFNVHYNRSPIPGKVEYVRHHPAKLKNHHMTSMHYRSLFRFFPIYENSPHIVENERTVTKIRGAYRNQSLWCYVVQIAGGSVRGIQSSVSEGQWVDKGAIFGMIRIGSQVDVILPWKRAMTVHVKPGMKVRAGKSILIT